MFYYKALEGESTSPARGTVAADSPRSARDMLRSRGLRILSLQTAQPATRPGLIHLLGRKRSSQLPLFIRELATLLAVGVPVAEALSTISRQLRGPFRTSVEQLREGVLAGLSLAEAMRQQPLVFDALCSHLVAVGEDAGNLDETLAHLADFQDRQTQLKGKLGSALLYPAIVMLMAIGVSIFLMTYVVPRLLEGLAEADRAVPWPTQVVMSLSDLLVRFGWLLSLIGLGLVIGLCAILAIPSVKRIWHRLIFRLPLIGPLLVKQQISRLAIVLSTLLKAGIMFTRAFEIVDRSTSNLAVQSALRQGNKLIIAGHSIASALEATRLFPPTVVHVFGVGEQSGRLEEMLDRLAVDYDRQVNIATTRLTTALEPLLIIFLVCFIGLIAFATILPMLEAGHVL
ncbi:MAG: type II secretion system F family protein [Phycisphaeraceae bacterium]|nr:type II secretion system F family protein [Phycisphaeraceae bacterium]